MVRLPEKCLRRANNYVGPLALAGMAEPTKNDAETSTRTVKTVEKTCQIIEALRELDGAGITQLSDHLGFSKGAVHSHLATLCQHEFVVQRGNQYYVSLKFLDIGEYARNQYALYRVAKPELDAIVEDNENLRAQLIIEEHGLGSYVYVTRGQRSVDTASHPGQRNYLHQIAAGKTILAHLSEARIDEIIDRFGLPASTDATISERDELLEELDRIHERGVAFNDEEKMQGIRGVAAPVHTRDGKVLGSVSVAGPTSWMKEDRFRERVPDLVTNAANVIQINAQVEEDK